MRAAFLKELYELARQDPRIIFMTGDLGFSVVETFMQDLPRQFINAGVAEQNMTGMAAGMALSGKIVFTYSIANFPTLRCLEHIRNDVCYHNADVKIVAVGGGFAYGALGATHHATEDLSVVRALPGIVVLAPGDPVEARYATRAAVQHAGPVYLRLGKAGEVTVHPDKIDFQVGKALRVSEGANATLISTGSFLPTAVKVAEVLRGMGVPVRVLSMHTLKPLDEEAVVLAAQQTGAIFTLEEHSIIGGLGGAVAEVLAERDDVRVIFKRIGLAPEFSPHIGSQSYMQKQHGLDVESLAHTVLSVLGAGAQPRHEMLVH